MAQLPSWWDSHLHAYFDGRWMQGIPNLVFQNRTATCSGSPKPAGIHSMLSHHVRNLSATTAGLGIDNPSTIYVQATRLVEETT